MAPLVSALRKLVEEPAPHYRTAPNNIEAERALLGAILINNEAFGRIPELLDAAHFFEPIHREIFEICSNLIRAGKIATPVTLKPFLDANADIGRVRQILSGLAKDHPKVLELAGAPVTKLSAQGVTVYLRGWCASSEDAQQVEFDLYEEARKRLDQEKIGVH